MAKIALITGATTGIGYELARCFAADGYELVLVARDAARLEEVAREMGTISRSPVRVISADLARPDSAWTIFEQVKTVDCLVNNAGFGVLGPFTDSNLSQELEMIQVNATSLVHLTKLFLKGMRERGGGRILNVASTAAFQPGPLMAVYYASKAFVLSFSEAIAEELRGSGITVTVLCPGPTATEFVKRARMEGTRLFRDKLLGLMSAREVAEMGYQAMMNGRVVVIPGLLNRLGVQVLRISPRAMVRRVARLLQES
ncbi:MAG TPA: SDR family oxidoreductase [Bryobacteraceae bacterium]|nr:SDR family oxidoreductase [Bryobacteraceae bacterium]